VPAYKAPCGIGGSQRDLDRVRIHLSVAKRIVSSMVSLVLSGRPRMKVPWMTMPNSWQSLVNRLATSTRMPFLMFVEDLLIAGLIPDSSSRNPLSFMTFKVVTRDVGLGVARPDNSELTDLARQLFDTRQVVGQRIVVEEELLDLRKGRLAHDNSSITWPTLRVR